MHHQPHPSSSLNAVAAGMKTIARDLLLATLCLVSVVCAPSLAQVLVNGGVVSGDIAVPGEVDTYFIPAGAVEMIAIRVVDPSAGTLTPRLKLYSPSNVLKADDSGGDVAAVEHFSLVSGTYRLEVSGLDASPLQVGAYEIHFAKMPGANEHGEPALDGIETESITLGDLDTYRMMLTAGENVTISMRVLNSTGLVWRISIYKPSGWLQIETVGSTFTTASLLPFTATETGLYTIYIRDGSPDLDRTADYELQYFRAPGSNENGLLPSIGSVFGDLTIGDLDSYTIPASVGSLIQLSLTDLDGGAMKPRLELYDPSGASMGGTDSPTEAVLNRIVPSTGIYTLLVRDESSFGGVGGPYELRLDGGAGVPFCFGDGGGGACPCGNSATGQGCKNSSGQGAELLAIGTAMLSNDTFALFASGAPGSVPGLLLRGSMPVNGGAGNTIGDGLLCISGQSARSQVKTSFMGNTIFTDFNGSGFGQSSNGLGTMTYYQYWYRDPGPFCGGSDFNFSNAWKVEWLP